MLIGRTAECAALDASLSAVREGRSEALVLLGEPGVGKSALLTYTTEAAADLEIVRVAGVEAEMELPFAALHQLCLPLLDRLEHLPAPQSDAIATTFGLHGGAAPGPFLVGLGVLNLLAEAAQQRPVLCVVDDAQWLDAASAQVVAFVARRLRAESVLMVIATRQRLDTLSGLTELVVRGLSDGDARQLLSSVVRWPLDDGVRTAVLAEAGGNPLALLELPLGSPGTLAGGFGLLDTPVLASRIEESFQNRVDDLPPESRLLLLVAAADPVGDPVLMWRAAAALGLSRGAGRAVEASGLLTIGVRVVFRHPLVRSAVYRAAPQADRRRIHRALAEVTSREVDPDRRAWHLAHATSEEDEVVATELEASAGRAQARGGLSAAAAFLERAAALTADSAHRADRELAAAANKYQAGLPDEARALLDRADAGPSDDLRSAQVRQLRGHLAFAAGHGADAPTLLLDTARRFERLDSVRARETYLDAVTYALLAGRFAGAAAVSEIAAAVRAAPPPVRVGSTSAPDLLLDALAVLYTDGHEAGAPMVRRALDAFGRDELSRAESIRWLSIACHGAYELWDDEAWQALATLHLQHARAAGALVMLPVALNQRITAHLHAGEVAAAVALVEETDAVAEATGIARPTYGAAAVAAWRGQESEALRLIRSAVNIVTLRREGIGLTLMQHANAVLHNGLGRFPEALKAAELATADPAETAFASWALSELVEAAARCGDRALAARAVERLARTTGPSNTHWSRGTQARARALVSDGAEAEDLHREALDRLGRCRGAFPLARAQQVYGEWLRQEGRVDDARAPLRRAYDQFVAMGTEAFAARARYELLAMGDAVPTRAKPETLELTAQERQIAQRARDGRSNAEIGAELFLSARTIEWHLRKVFGKLGITSRRELRDTLPVPRPGRSA